MIGPLNLITICGAPPATSEGLFSSTLLDGARTHEDTHTHTRTHTHTLSTHSGLLVGALPLLSLQAHLFSQGPLSTSGSAWSLPSGTVPLTRAPKSQTQKGAGAAPNTLGHLSFFFFLIS